MNFLPAQAAESGLEVAGHRLGVAPEATRGKGPLTLGVRPEYLRLAGAGSQGALPAVVMQAQDIGTYWLLTAQVAGGDSLVRARLSPHEAIPKVGETVWLTVLGPRTCFYGQDQQRVGETAP
jgi:glycerol transport system ATP-binding protein